MERETDREGLGESSDDEFLLILVPLQCDILSELWRTWSSREYDSPPSTGSFASCPEFITTRAFATIALAAAFAPQVDYPPVGPFSRLNPCKAPRFEAYSKFPERKCGCIVNICLLWVVNCLTGSFVSISLAV